MRTLSELYFRRNLCLFFIQKISEVPKDDPRRADALVEYNRQLAEIDQEIAAIEGKPPDTVIGLKPGILFAKGEKVG